MKRKTEQDIVQRFGMREVQPRAKALRKRLEQWAADNEQTATTIYSTIEPLDIENDRMADLLMPLQAVLRIDEADKLDKLDILSAYAASLEERDKRPESQSSGVRLLTACREIFKETDLPFIYTEDLLKYLVLRNEEPWHKWNRGEGLNDEGLAKLLRPFEIKSTPDKKRLKRGYYCFDFEDSWTRYLAPLEKPSSPSIPSSPSRRSKL